MIRFAPRTQPPAGSIRRARGRATESKMTEKEILQIEIERAKHELEYAENRLNNADQDYVEAAVYELLAKQKKLDALIRKAKEYA